MLYKLAQISQNAQGRFSSAFGRSAAGWDVRRIAPCAGKETDIFDRASRLEITICGTPNVGGYDYEIRNHVRVQESLL